MGACSCGGHGIAILSSARVFNFHGTRGTHMRIRNKTLLEAVFALKGNYRAGIAPEHREYDGIEIAPFKNDAKAAACVSADLELSWAFRMLPKEVAQETGRRTRENLPYLLRTFEDCAFPITWATVGHLFLESCERASTGLAHPDMPRPPRNEFWAGDWYMHDPCTDYKRDPFWYAPDVIQSILGSPVGHEIGTHSFSHIDFTPSRSDPTLVRREIEESITAMQRFGVKPRSLVYPFNEMGHTYLNLLSDLSITAVRHRDRWSPTWCTKIKRPRVKLSYPERTSFGVYKLYESINLRQPSHYDYLDRVKILMKKAQERRAVFHLWFHPSDPANFIEGELRRAIQFIDDQRKKDLVWIATMGEIAAYCEARERLRPEVERKEGEIRLGWRGSFQSDRYGHTELSLIFPSLPRPRQVLMTDGNGRPRPEPANSYVYTPEGRLMVNMPTSAQSLRLVF